ncbi:unnamed protein product [Clonostachys byssicola]|uniref:Uncharacterized protein n=1 Tax=Clonostachys byssicola TaxID=160290 RepID=A0A9N9UGB6_9HYPO|nr:unnamed protein product [Clonostachys byssicola]
MTALRWPYEILSRIQKAHQAKAVSSVFRPSRHLGQRNHGPAPPKLTNQPGVVPESDIRCPVFVFSTNGKPRMNVTETSLQQPPLEIGPLPRQNILNNAGPVLETILRATLSNVLRIVRAARGILNPNDGTTMAALKTAFPEVSAAYFVPHYYLLKPDLNNPIKKVLDNTVEIPIPKRAAEAKTLFDTLWTPDASRKIINMAYRIYHWVIAEDDELNFAGGGVSMGTLR